MERGQLELTPDAVDTLLEELEQSESADNPSHLAIKLTAAQKSLAQHEEDVVMVTVSEDDVARLIDMLPAPSPKADQTAIDLRDYLTTYLRELRS
jgi:hypothetical protein